uniref:Uncharacterized protein n=1 Tax=Ananas comosus var. bracteatus TaxID=296719 RepID=A0A6V7NW67_ANACO|nr:unnamed protein product [Ananas comosus var. bracteatus]
MRCDDDGSDQRRCGESSGFCGHDGDGSEGDSEGGGEVESLWEKGSSSHPWRRWAPTSTWQPRAKVAGPSSSSSSPKNPKRFEIEKWNAVALRAWGTKPNPHSPLDGLAVSSMVRVKIYEDIVVDGCAICRSHIMDLCELDLLQRVGVPEIWPTKAAISYSILYSIFPNAIFRVFGTTMGTDF